MNQRLAALWIELAVHDIGLTRPVHYEDVPDGVWDRFWRLAAFSFTWESLFGLTMITFLRTHGQLTWM